MNDHFYPTNVTVVIKAVVPNGWVDMPAKERKKYLRQLQRKHFKFLHVIVPKNER